MTSKQRFEDLKNYIEADDVDVEVDTSYYEQAKTPPEERIINGTAGTDSYIILYKDSKDSNYNMLSSLLIHEYGHVINWRDYGKDRHSEKDAWEAGILNIPREFHPPTLREDCVLCLSSYNITSTYAWIDEILKSINTI